MTTRRWFGVAALAPLLVIGAIGAALPGCGDDVAALAPDAGVTPDAGAIDEDYAFVVLPDTQYYASSWPDIFTAQTQWIAGSRQALNIAFVLHTGDIVDADAPVQWMAASQSLGVLDGVVPYVLTAGNHDYLDFADRMGMINSYFPPSRFSGNSWFGGTFEPGHIENSFSLVPVGAAPGAGPWLILALEFGPRDEVLTWAGSILARFPDTPAIIITHAYLYRDGTRYDRAGAAEQQYNPHAYVMIGQASSSINDGAEMWRKLIEPHANVKLVFSGHDVDVAGGLPPGTASLLTSTRADGTTVHQVLANYQSCVTSPCDTNASGAAVHGGNGFLRIVRVSPAARTLTVSTYSPFVDQHLADPSNQFTLPLP